MPDVIGNIQLRTTGGDESASEINKATTSLNNMTSASSGMEGQFQHRFQHIGLVLFAQDALRASGLGGETRQIINLMNIALTGAGQAFGLAGGPALLLVAGLTALVGIAYKVVEAHKDMTEQLQKVSAAHEKTIKTTDDTIKALRDLRTELGYLPKALRDVLVAEEELRKQEILNQEVINQGLVVSLNQRIAKEKDLVDTLKDESEQLKTQTEQLEKYLKPGMEGYTMLERAAASYNATQKKLSEANTKLLTDQAQLNTVISKQINLLHGVTSSVTEQTASIKASEEAWDKTAKAADAYWKAWAKAGILADKENEKLAKKMANDLAAPIGDAFAKMIVEGKDFAESMTEAFKQMAERIISDIIRIEVEMAVLEAMGFPGAGMGGGFFGGMMATGGDMIADRPTMAIFGEAGPERATFTPLSGTSSGGGGGGGGGGVNIGTIEVNAYGVTDPKEIASRVGQEIVKTIRGQGQISFVRA